MTGPFDDLSPTEAELAEVWTAIGEAEYEEWLGEQDASELGLPGDTASDLANDYGLASDYGLDEVSELAGSAVAAEQRRAEQDAQDARAGRRLPEDRLARALDRIQSGTYLPGPMYRDREADGRFRSETACHAHRDEFGNCGARFHDAGCLTVALGEAATGSAEAAEAWRRTLNAGAPVAGARLLASADYGDVLDEAAGIGGPADTRALGAMRAILGLPAVPGPARPSAGSLAEEIGLA